MHLNFITVYIAISSTFAGISAFPVDVTNSGGLHKRYPSIPQYGGMQSVFERGPDTKKPKTPVGRTTPPKDTPTTGQLTRKPSTAGTTGNNKGGFSGTCRPPKHPLKKNHPPLKAAPKGPVTKAKGRREFSLYRRTTAATVWTATQDPTIPAGSNRGQHLGGGNWGDVYQDPLNANQVIKKFKLGSADEAGVQREIKALQLVGQYANKWGYKPSGSTAAGTEKIWFIYMHKVPGASFTRSPLWLKHMGTQSEEEAKNYISCAIRKRLAEYGARGIRHPDLFQGNTMLAGNDLESMTADFVDWEGLTIQNPIVPPTDAELDAMTKKAMEPVEHSYY